MAVTPHWPRTTAGLRCKYFRRSKTTAIQRLRCSNASDAHGSSNWQYKNSTNIPPINQLSALFY